MSKATHTETPWAVVDGRQIYGPNREDELLAEVTDTCEGLEGGDATADANARLIVRAVNLHADLLAACEHAAAFLSQLVLDGADYVPLETRLAAIGGAYTARLLNDAIAKAKKESP